MSETVILIGLVAFVIVFMIGRAIMLWYLRIDEMVDLLSQIRDELAESQLEEANETN